MSEDTVNERRNWKAMALPYDYYLPDDSKSCMYCLTDKQAELLRAILLPVGWRTRWWSDTNTPIDVNAIEGFRDDLIRRLMMDCCNDNLIFRWTIDLVLESSDDGGTTWSPAPQDDPRYNSPQFPPMPGPDDNDKKCIAATGAAALMKAQVAAQLTDGMSSYSLQEVLSDWVNQLLATGGNIFQTLLTIAANQILALGITALVAALTDPVWETMKCIIYCHMQPDASFTDADLDAITTDIGDQIGGIATLFLQQLVNLLGVVGMTNLARSGAAATGDCDECDCGDTCDNSWTVAQAGSLSGPDENGWYTLTSASYNGHQFIDIWTDDINNCCTPTEIDLMGSTINLGYTHVLCGYSRTIEHLVSSVDFVGGPQDKCINYFVMESSTAFVVKVKMENCPS